MPRKSLVIVKTPIITTVMMIVSPLMVLFGLFSYSYWAMVAEGNGHDHPQQAWLLAQSFNLLAILGIVLFVGALVIIAVREIVQNSLDAQVELPPAYDPPAPHQG